MDRQRQIRRTSRKGVTGSGRRRYSGFFNRAPLFAAVIFFVLLAMACSPTEVVAQTLVTLQPSGGANDGTDDGSAHAGKDAGIWPAPWQDKNIGEIPEMYLWNSSCNVGLIPAYLQFSLAGMPREHIEKAEIALYTLVRFNGNGWPWPPGTWTLAMRRALEPWNEMEIKPGNEPAVDSTIASSRTVTTVGGGSWGVPFTEFEGWLTYDITDVYRAWTAGTFPNYGVRLSQEEDWCANGNDIVVYTSDQNDNPANRPKLIVTQSCLWPPSDMVAWWRGEGSPNDAAGGNHGTAENGATYAAGMVGQAFSIDGVNDFILVPDSSALRPAQFTVQAWVRLNSGDTDGGIIATKHASPNGGEMSYALWLLEGTWQGRTKMDGTVYDVDSGVAAVADEWVHLALTNDGTSLKIYVNGSEHASTPVSGTIDYGNEPFLIGNYDRNPSSTNGFGGLIDEVVFFDRALSAQEIADMYQADGSGLCVSRYNLAVTVSGGGTVTSDPTGISCGTDCEESYEMGADVTLTANPDPAFFFAGWGGDCSACGKNNTCMVIMSADTTCTADFERTCSYTLSSSAASVKYKGKTLSVKVQGTGALSCPAPDLVVSDTWLTATVKSFANNKGVVKVTAGPNAASILRDGEVTIGGEPFAVNQAGAPCRITGIDPVKRAIEAAGGTYTLAVGAPEGCTWSAGPDAKTTWITIDSGSQGAGGGLVTYTVESNATGKNRSGKILVVSSENRKKTHTAQQTP
mgnify:CR=1 FL=1